MSTILDLIDEQNHAAIFLLRALAQRLDQGLRRRQCNGALIYGSRIRPGAPLIPAWVWHELQSPLLCGASITRS